jgi:hypothetical protein
MPVRIKLAVAMVLFAMLSSLPGCGEDFGDRQEVSGTVQMKAQPRNDASREFRPRGVGAEGATKSGSLITKGQYKIPRSDGLLPGKYRVSITAGDGRTPVDSPDGLPGPTGANIVSKELVPSEYNVESKQEVEVKSGQPNVFNYEIP